MILFNPIVHGGSEVALKHEGGGGGGGKFANCQFLYFSIVYKFLSNFYNLIISLMLD